MDIRRLAEVSPTNKIAAWTRYRKLERTLNAAARAIDDFPDNQLRMDSPVILELRNTQVADHTYVEVLKRIFPSAQPHVISSLMAWIIVDVYLCRMEGQQDVPTMDQCLAAQAAATSLNDRTGLHQIQISDKAREMLGIGIPDATSIRMNVNALRKRATAVRASIGVIGQKLVQALRGSWDEDIWRSLRVLVEIIESTSQPWR